jgi:hypothetical protein
MAHPAGVGDDRNALPLRQVIDRNLEIVPSGARKAAADFVIEAQPVVPLQ